MTGTNKLRNLDVSTLKEVTALTTLENPHVFCCWGNKGEKEILAVLKKLGLKLEMTDDDWDKYESKSLN